MQLILFFRYAPKGGCTRAFLYDLAEDNIIAVCRGWIVFSHASPQPLYTVGCRPSETPSATLALLSTTARTMPASYRRDKKYSTAIANSCALRGCGSIGALKYGWGKLELKNSPAGGAADFAADKAWAVCILAECTA